MSGEHAPAGHARFWVLHTWNTAAARLWTAVTLLLLTDALVVVGKLKEKLDDNNRGFCSHDRR
jgi:hypothetical protein